MYVDQISAVQTGGKCDNENEICGRICDGLGVMRVW